MGRDFYRQAIAHQKRFGGGKAVSNAFQTNGLLIDRKWAEFFRKYQFLIGLSLDGPEHIHDKYRKHANSKGSWAKVHACAKSLLSRGVQVNAMTCLTDYSAKYPEIIYRYHKTLGMNYMQFIPVVEKNNDAADALAPFSVTAQQYGHFMCCVFDLWLADFRGGQPTTSIRLFETLFFRSLGQTSPQCTFQEQCGQYLVVEHNGDVFPCDFYVNPEWKLGNVMNGRLKDFLNSKKMTAFRRMKQQLAERCGSCGFKPFCFGGCTKDRTLRREAENENYFCQAYNRIFEHALPVLKQLARQWR